MLLPIQIKVLYSILLKHNIATATVITIVHVRTLETGYIMQLNYLKTDLIGLLKFNNSGVCIMSLLDNDEMWTHLF